MASEAIEEALGAGARGSDIEISTDASRLDLDMVHEFLAGSYWAAGIPREVVERAVRHSLCFGAYLGDRQVGFARVISDRATFAYVSDVFVLPSERGRGVGGRLMAAIMAHPDLQGLRRWTLVHARCARAVPPLRLRRRAIPRSADGDLHGPVRAAR